MEAKGKTILKVVGIIFIIAGAIATVTYLGGTLLGGALIASGGSILGAAVVGLFVVSLAWSILELVTGILGVMNCNKPEKAGTLYTLGIILLVLSIISGLWTIANQGASLKNILSLILGLILPVLFVYGAKQNKES